MFLPRFLYVVNDVVGKFVVKVQTCHNEDWLIRV
jgi:hypothetical protein